MFSKFWAATVLLAVVGTAPLPAQQIDTVRLAEIRVIGTAAELSRIPGSASLISPTALSVWRAHNINDVLRQVPGIAVREEEGLGLRPNIGVRGLNPTRSSKVLILEDGIPVTFAPYGDNASYYHPPVTRFDHVEVLRGAGQIAFGPQTVGGVINYITPAIPLRSEGKFAVTGGDRRFLDISARGGTTIGAIGALATFNHRQAEGSRENIGTDVNDVMLKATRSIGDRNTITVRGNFYRERSNVTYSGLTEAEWETDPYSNPFRNDSMKLDRWGASATHALTLSPSARMTTTIYGSAVKRHWWRQSSNSAQRPNDASDATCGGMANLNTTCGNEGRLRSYRHYGVEPRWQAHYSLFGVPSALEAGLRWHTEQQDRRQLNGATPTAREAGPSSNTNSGVVENNLRENTAWSGFMQQRLAFGRMMFTPGVRVEHISYERTNLRNDVSGKTKLTQLIPGAGLMYEVKPSLQLFVGAHRGFAPPRTEDIIDNNTGATIDLDAELSWNYEAGLRGYAGPLHVEVTAFRLDFENQIIPASIAGGTGAALTNAGRTLHQGIELGAKLDAGKLLSIVGPYIDGVLTWIPTARFEGDRYAFVGTAAGDVPGKVYAAQNAASTRTQVNVGGNRLPYAPSTTYTLAVGHQRGDRFDVRLERHAVAEQFTDPANTHVRTADGQQGTIDGYAIWNVAAAYRLPKLGTRVFATLRNLTEELYVADRSRGLLPGAPRSVHVGLMQAF